MLTMFWPFDGIISWVNKTFHQILLLIDGCIYWAVSQAYQIFIRLADARIFEDAFFSNFAQRIYAILGVIMLFYLAYALLNALVDPDKAMQGDKGLPKLAQNIVISLVILGLLPTLFDYAYKIQGIMFKENVIGSIIFGTGGSGSDDNNGTTIETYGNYMAYTALVPFLNPANYNVSLANDYSWYDLKAELIKDGQFTRLPIMADWAIEPQKLISPSDADDLPVDTVVNLDYKPFISTLCGIALLYIMASFCLDLGVRIIKFAFCQLIAPIPVVMRMIPGKKGSFDKWLKLTLTVYFEVFIRVGIMYMVIYFFSEIANLDIFNYAYENADGIRTGIQGTIVLAIILMGLLTFAKQAPKMIGEVLGLDSGNIKLGVKDKLKAGGFFAATAMAGAGATMITRHTISGVKRIGNNWKENWSNAKVNAKRHMDDARFEDDRWNRKGAALDVLKAGGSFLPVLGHAVADTFKTAGSTAAGATSGVVHAGAKGKDAKGFKDMVKSAQTGVEISTANKGKREEYKARHGGTFRGAMAGHFTDVYDTAKTWATGDSSYSLNAKEQRELDILKEFQSKVKAMEGLWKNEKAWIDAASAKRNAQVQANVAEQTFNAHETGQTADFIRNLKAMAASRPNMKVDDLFKATYEGMKKSGVNKDTLKAIMDNQHSMKKDYEEMLRTRKDSEYATRVLSETEQSIKLDKASAIRSFGQQLDAFREKYSEYSQFIGTAGQGSTVTTKTAYTNEINKLNLKVDTLGKKDKK